MTYDPLLKLSSTHMLTAIDAHLDLELHRTDVLKTFWHGLISGDIYIHSQFQEGVVKVDKKV